MKIVKAILTCIYLFMLFCIGACEKPFLDEDLNKKEGTTIEQSQTVIFKMADFTEIPFTYISPGLQAGSSTCSRLEISIYSGEKRIKWLRQVNSDDNFGTMYADIPTGTYRIIALAHNCNGSATMTIPGRITFPKNKVTDTFFFSDILSVERGKTYALHLQRAVAAVQYILPKEKVKEVKTIEFKYTGGSSTLDGINGVGIVNSRQTEVREVPTEGIENGFYTTIYTFPKRDSKFLKVTVTLLNANDNVISSSLYSSVSIMKNGLLSLDDNRTHDESEEDENEEEVWTTDVYYTKSLSQLKLKMSWPKE